MQSSVDEVQASTADTDEAACEQCEIKLGRRTQRPSGQSE